MHQTNLDDELLTFIVQTVPLPPKVSSLVEADYSYGVL